MMTPEELVKRGFKYWASGTSGCDQWQGLSHWIHKEKGIHLRGNISTASGGSLQLWSTPNIRVDNLEELDKLISLFK